MPLSNGSSESPSKQEKEDFELTETIEIECPRLIQYFNVELGVDWRPILCKKIRAYEALSKFKTEDELHKAVISMIDLMLLLPEDEND